jgi:hypothetical protein
MNKWRELVFPVESLRNTELVIEDDRAAVVTDPLRWRILETLDTGKSVAEISQELGVTDTRLLYHLKRLAQIDIVSIEDEFPDHGKWYCWPLMGKIRVREMIPSTDDLPEAIPEEVVREFNQAFLEVAEGVFGTASQISVNHNRSRLSEDQAAEFNRRLLELIEEFFPPTKGDQSGIKYGFYGVLTPIDLHPLGDCEES